MITTVTFDLWNTLIHDTRENGETRTASRLDQVKGILQRSNINITIDALKQGYFQCLHDCVNIRSTGKDVTFSEQIRIFLDNSEVGIYENLDHQAICQVENAYADVYLTYPSVMDPTSLNLIRALKSLRIKLGIISNTSMTPGTTFRKFLFSNKIGQYFDALIFSDELQTSKPDRYIYDYTLSKLSSAPSESLHVGDQYSTDVKGSIGAGMKSALIDPKPDQGTWDVGPPTYTFPSLSDFRNDLKTVLENS